jgi:hypothetical protein
MAGLAALILSRGRYKLKPYASRASKRGFVVLITPYTPRILECSRISCADPE